MDDVPLLLGITSEGKFVSLINCFVLKSGILAAPLKGSQEIRPRRIAYDVHFDGLEDFRLLSLSIHYSNLDEWTAIPAFKVEYSKSSYNAVSVNYVKPEPLRAELPTGLTAEVSFSTSVRNFSGARNEMKIHQRAWIKVSATTGQSYDELNGEVTAIADLVSLFIGQPMRPIESQASAVNSKSRNSEDKSISFRLVDNADPVAPPLANVEADRMLFSLNEIRGRFADTLQGWHVHRNKHQPLHNLFFGTLRRPAEQLGSKSGWGAMLRRIFQNLGKFPFDPAPEQGAHVPVNCRI